MQEMQVRSLGQDPLEKEIATRTSILAWKIPWTEEFALPPGIEPAPPALEGEVLTAGPPGKSQDMESAPRFPIVNTSESVENRLQT